MMTCRHFLLLSALKRDLSVSNETTTKKSYKRVNLISVVGDQTKRWDIKSKFYQWRRLPRRIRMEFFPPTKIGGWPNMTSLNKLDCPQPTGEDGMSVEHWTEDELSKSNNYTLNIIYIVTHSSRYEQNLKHVRWFSINSLSLDRSLIHVNYILINFLSYPLCELNGTENFKMCFHFQTL